MILIKILIFIIALIVIAFLNIKDVTTTERKYGEEKTKTEKTVVFAPIATASAVIATFFLIVLVSSFGVISSGNVGVVTRFGGIEQGRIIHEGAYSVLPLVEHVEEINTKPHLIELDNDDAVTQDRQAVKTTVKLQVQVDPAIADQTYREYRDTIVDQVVMPKFQEAVKTVTARYDAATQVKNRGLVQSEMLAYVQHELQGKGVLIPPGALSITNFSYASDYQEAIEATAVAQQNLVKANAELKVTQVEAQKAVAESRGVSESQALLARTLTDNSLKFEFFKHWDGKLPLVVGGGGNIMDVQKLLDNAQAAAKK